MKVKILPLYSVHDSFGRVNNVGHGLKDDGVYGKIDHLHLTYDGNRLKSVLEDALPVTRYATADFADLTDRSTEYSYDECGAMISDSNQGILSISYDNSGNPRLTQFASGEQVDYVYTPSGQKVREIHRSPKTPVIGTALPAPHEMFADTTDYIGPVIYRDGKPDMVRYAGGYASLSRSGTKYVPAFHHYITDYLGSNRAVVRASDGAFVQVTHYYPWGSVYGDMGTGASVQPYKYGDKELDRTAGVSRYDYSARAYYAAIPRFDRPDALAGKYPHISPYAFCANNPVNVTDPTGEDIVVLNYTEGQHLAMLIQDENGKWQYYSVNGNNVVNPISKEHTGGRPFNDIAIGSWDTPREFFESPYNMRTDDSKEDKSKNHFGFQEGYQIPSTPEQDAIMRDSFIEKSKTTYSILGNNCATAVQSAMFDADIPVASPKYERIHVPANIYIGESGYDIIRPNFNPLPSVAFKSIMELNPDGTYIHK